MSGRASVLTSVLGVRRIALAAAGLLVLGACSSCGSGGATVGAVAGSAPASGIEAPDPPTGTVAPQKSPSAGSAGSAGEPAPGLATEPARALPNLVGKGLQVAQDRAQAAGFRRMTSHDASGRERVQIFDRDWRVCFQSPAAGRHAADTKLDFGTVKLAERCPAKDKGDTPARRAKQRMPDLEGKSAAAAFALLGLDASITWRDGTGAERSVLLPTNWKVCAQKPRPGAKYDGVPVILTVVKIREHC